MVQEQSSLFGQALYVAPPFV